MCASVGQRGAVGGGQQARASRAWGTIGTQPRFTLKVIQDAFPETLDKRTGGQLGRERAGPQTSRVQVRATSLEEFQTLRTDQEVQDFSVQVGAITKMQLDETWPVERYLDGILMEHRYVVKNIPKALRYLYAEALALALRLVRDFPETPRAWAVYLSLPFLCLQTCQSFRNTGPKMREMGLRLLRFIRGDIEALYLDAVVLRQTNKERRIARESAQGVQGEGTSSWSPQAAAFFRDGKWSLAMQELEKNGGDLHRSLTVEAQQVIDQKLKHTLLPPQDVCAHMAELKRRQTKVYSVTPAEVKKVIGRRNLNKGGGFSGHRYSHMAAALQNEGARAELLTLLADVVNIVMSGRIPLPLIPYTHGGLGNIAGAKRLFVAMEVIVRLADAALQSKYIKDKGVESLFKFNVGVGVAGAADVLASWLASTLQMHHSVADLVLLELDAHNMFLEIDRLRLLQIVVENHPELYASVSYYSCKQFVAFFQGGLLEEFSGGIPIGAGLSSLIASLVEEVVLERLQQMHGNRILGLKAFIDNVFIVVQASNVRTITNSLSDLGRPYGLIYHFRESHPHKMHFPFPCARLAEWQAEFVGWEITAVDSLLGAEKQGNVFAGVPVGSSSYLSLVVNKAVDRAVQKLNLVFAVAPPQEAVMLVQGCVISTLDYTRRTVHEVVAEEHWKRFDDAVVDGLERAMGGVGWRAFPKVEQQLFLPGSLAGLSFRRFQGTAEAAILASYSAAFKFRGSSTPEPVGFNSQVKRFNNQQVRPADRVPEGYRDLMQKLCLEKKPQKYLTRLVRLKCEEQFRAGLSAEQLVQVGAMRDTGALLYLLSADWGSVLPLYPGVEPHLTPEEFKYLFRRALVALPNPHNLDPSLVTTCGRYFVSSGARCECPLDLRLSHAESKCKGVRGQKKHDAIQTAVIVVARELGLAAGAKGDILGSTVHGDLTISGHQPRSLVVDVKNFNPISQDVGKEKAAKERKNEGHYKMVCAAAGMDFASFITTVWGGFSKSAELVLKMLVSRLVVQEDVTNSWASTTVRRRIQVSFMKQIALNGLATMRKIQASKSTL